MNGEDQYQRKSFHMVVTNHEMRVAHINAGSGCFPRHLEAVGMVNRRIWASPVSSAPILVDASELQIYAERVDVARTTFSLQNREEVNRLSQIIGIYALIAYRSGKVTIAQNNSKLDELPWKFEVFH